MVAIVNLTPHSILLRGKEILPAGQVARLGDNPTHVDDVDGIVSGDAVPIYIVSYDRIHGLPEKVEDTWYIVSLPVAQAVAGERDDVFFPYPLRRDAGGNVIGAEGLAQVVLPSSWRPKIRYGDACPECGHPVGNPGHGNCQIVPVP
jgi:hypothetical protein